MDSVTSGWINEMKQAQRRTDWEHNPKTMRELEKEPTVDVSERLARERAQRASKKPREVEVFIYGKGREVRVATKEVLPETREQW